MPDYDPKNIPTLDDIIEDDEFNAAALDSTELDSKGLDSIGMDSTGHDHADLDHSNLNHTNLDSVDIINVDLNTDLNTDASRIEPEERAEAEDSKLDLFLLDLCLDETSEQQSDLAGTSSDKNHYDTNDGATDTSPAFDVAPSNTLKISLDPSELETIVESVVNKLLPDLEQHLRTQLRQTLEDKLSEEVSTLLNSETTQNSNTS